MALAMGKNVDPAKISFLLQDLAGGGAERVMLVLASELHRAGHKVELLLVRAAGAYLAEVPTALGPTSLGTGRTRNSLPILVRHLRRKRPDWLVSALSHVNLMAIAATSIARCRTRSLITEHNCVRGNPQLPGGIFARRLMPPLYRLADRIVAVSEGVADDLAIAAQLSRERIDVVYNPIVGSRIANLAQAEPPHPWLRDKSVPVVLGIGRLDTQKDFANLLRAFAVVHRSRKTRLVILGEGPERAALLSLATEHGLAEDTLLPGFVSNPYAWLRHASLFALSSAWEGLPTVLVEALACGVPVVATDCRHGPREILANGVFGRLVPPHDPAALAEAISAVLEAPPLSARLVERAADFTIDKAVGRYERLMAVDRPCA